MKRFTYLAFMALMCLFASCGKSDEPDIPGGNPDKPVDDPAGTVSIILRNDFGSTINDFGINKADNFAFDWGGGYIVDLGAMKGLGNVTYIPTEGWASSCAVIPGHGYVVYYDYYKTFMRLYVEEYVTSITNEILGAQVKYQKPFKGYDGEIKLESNQIGVDADGGTIPVRFTGNNYIPFTVQSSAAWCRPSPASTNNLPFLNDAVALEVDRNVSSSERGCTVTIKTEYGKETLLKVKQAATGPFLVIGSGEGNDVSLGWQGGNLDFPVYTNLEKNDISISSDSDWLTAEWQTPPTNKRPIQFIHGKSITRSMLQEPETYSLQVVATGNVRSQRHGAVILSYNSGGEKKEINVGVNQNGLNSTFEFPPIIEVNGAGAENMLVEVSWGDLWAYSNYIKVKSDCNWISVKYDWVGIYLTVEPNYIESQREAKIEVLYQDVVISESTVKQAKAKYEDQYLYFSGAGGNTMIKFAVPEGTKAESDNSDITASISNGKVVVRAAASSTDRKATITLSGIPAKLYVSQSKYKVNDTYQEGTLEGKVAHFDTNRGIGYIISSDLGYASYSKENVFIGATNSYDGKKNMEVIRKIPGYMNLYPAVALVENLNQSQSTDKWYLPAIDQFLYLGYALPNWDKWYSTSTEIDAELYYKGYNRGNDPRPAPSAKSQTAPTVALAEFNINFFN